MSGCIDLGWWLIPSLFPSGCSFSRCPWAVTQPFFLDVAVFLVMYRLIGSHIAVRSLSLSSFILPLICVVTLLLSNIFLVSTQRSRFFHVWSCVPTVIFVRYTPTVVYINICSRSHSEKSVSVVFVTKRDGEI